METFKKNENTISIIREVINDIYELVGSTYGPEGRTVVINNDDGEPYATKDGVSVAKAIYYEDPFRNSIARLIKQAAIETLETAGDGTTTSTILIREFVIKGLELLTNNIYTLKEVQNMLRSLEDITIKSLDGLSKRDISESDIYQIALTSSNNDVSIADIVLQAFKHSKTVTIDKGNDLDDMLDNINGMRIDTTYYDRTFINKKESASIQYNDADIIIIDGKLNDISTISRLISSTNPCIIIAEDFNEQVLQILKNNHNKGNASIGLVKSPGIGSHRKDLLEDIAIYTGGSVLEQNKKYYLDKGLVGKVDSIEIGKHFTTILKNEVLDTVPRRIEELEELLSNTHIAHDRLLIEKRLDLLDGKSAIIKVGGKSQVEINERYDRMDDAVRAVSCALEDGIVDGGGLSLAYISKEVKNPFESCLKEPFKRVFNMSPSESIQFDSSPLKESLKPFYKIIKDSNIVDPLKVTKTALSNAVSIAIILLSTSGIINNNQNRWGV